MFSLKIMRLSEFPLNFFQKWPSIEDMGTLLAKTLLLVHTLKLIDILLTSKSLYNPKLLHFDKQYIWLCHKGLNFISLTRWHFKVNVRRLNISTNFPAKHFQVFQSFKFCSYKITAGVNWMTLKYSEMPGSAFHIFNLIGTAMMGFFIGRIMVHTQILVQGWETRTRQYFSAVLQTDLNRCLLSFCGTD